MLRALVLAVTLALGAPPSGPVVRVASGAAHLLERRGVRTLERGAPPAELADAVGWLETGAGSEVELVWRGLASATVRGPAALQLAREPGLWIDEIGVLELEVRRGKLALAVADAGSFEVSAGALQLRSLPDGVFEVLNRGGTPLELRRVGELPVAIPAGQRLRFRAVPHS